MNNVRRIVNKGAYWSHHGNRRGVLGLACEINRSGRWKRKQHEMFPNIETLMKAYRRKP